MLQKLIFLKAWAQLKAFFVFVVFCNSNGGEGAGMH